MTDIEVRRVAGRAFEDILDGYFPLEESVRQMMDRQGFAIMLFTLLHAPIMNIKGLAPTDPVPFSLRKTYAGMIDQMRLTVVRTDDGVRLGGVGEWFWLDPREETARFSSLTRLGEPAFVRGVGISAIQGDGDMRQPGSLAVMRADKAAAETLPEASARLGWASCRAWDICLQNAVICQTSNVDESPMHFGTQYDASDKEIQTPVSRVSTLGDVWDYLLINADPGQTNREAQELLRHL